MKAPVQLPILRLSHYEHPCSYLPGREARMEFAFSVRLPAANYQRLLEQGFRRSGRMVYRPVCIGCRECQPIRVLAREFRPDRSMRRCWRANQDLDARIGPPQFSVAKSELYGRYLEARHEREPGDGPESFLYDSPVESREIEFRLGDQLVCVAIVDQVPSGLSAVYTYFDPHFAARSLGTFAVLWELEYCRRQGWPYYYLGYYVRDCRKMNYKTRFMPNELLSPDGTWRRQS